MDKNRIKHIIFKTLLIILLTVITIVILFPVYFVIATSLKDYGQYINNPIGINFTTVNFQNYMAVFESSNLLKAFFNSTFITLISVICTVVFSAIASFAISIIKFKGSKIFKTIAVVTMFFTGELTYVPLYLLYSKLGMLNSYWVLILPCILTFPSLGIMLGTNYLDGLPNEIHEAAHMDGAPLWRILLQIDLPLMRPVLSLIAIMAFQSAWSEFFWPMITTLGNENVHTLPLKILQFKAADATMFGEYCAGLTIMTIPMIIMYVFFSKYFIEGMTAGSVKS